MSKGLEAYKLFLEDVEQCVQSGGIHYIDRKNRNIIEKELKVLKIIKDICNLKVYKNKLGQCFLEGTNILFPISQEKYDLLKEVLL